MANRTDDLQSSQVEAANLWEVTNDLQAWCQQTVVELARLSKSEVKWSIASEDVKKSGKQRQGGFTSSRSGVTNLERHTWYIIPIRCPSTGEI